MKLGNIKMVEIKKLKRNKLNLQYFKLESRQYFDNLAADIRKRGILVPLVARADGTLLAGHNRLTIAQLLKIRKVPVQYVQGKLPAKEELAYVIKDNLFRRHLSYEERVALYQKVCIKFNERIMLRGALGISSKEIAAVTGLNPKTINYDLSRQKHLRRKEAEASSELNIANEKAISQYKKAVARMLNIAIMEKSETRNKFVEITESALTRLAMMEQVRAPQASGASTIAGRHILKQT